MREAGHLRLTPFHELFLDGADTGPLIMLESLPNAVRGINMMAGIFGLINQRASPKPPDDEHQESQK